jgi:hypothetical protein
VEKQQSQKNLYDRLRDGTVAMNQYDKNGNQTMSVEEIYNLSDQFLLYDPNKFRERLFKRDANTTYERFGQTRADQDTVLYS